MEKANHSCELEESFTDDGFSVSCICGWNDAFLNREDANAAIRHHYASDPMTRHAVDERKRKGG